MSEKPAGLVEAIDCAANTMRDMGCTNRSLAKVQEASLRKAKETTEQLVDSVLVLLRDYKAVHGDGDLEMQPALYQVRKSLEKAGATK